MNNCGGTVKFSSTSERVFVFSILFDRIHNDANKYYNCVAEFCM